MGSVGEVVCHDLVVPLLAGRPDHTDRRRAEAVERRYVCRDPVGGLELSVVIGSEEVLNAIGVGLTCDAVGVADLMTWIACRAKGRAKGSGAK